MATGDLNRSTGTLRQLAADAARLCGVQAAVIRCGDTVVARWDGTGDPGFLVAAQPFGVGLDGYEFQLFDDRSRALTPTELGVFRAMTEAVKRVLESMPGAPGDAGWVRDHVVVALDYVSDAFILLLSDWTVEHVNAECERQLGKTRDVLLGRNFWAAMPALLGTRFETEMRAAMQGNVPRIYEEFSTLSQRWLQSRAFPCAQGLAILTIDITSRKREERDREEAEDKLLQSRRMESLGTLASGVAHDFNNILGAILGHAGLLADSVSPGTPAHESVRQIGIAGARARDLVRQILTFGRATARSFTLRPLRPLLEESLALVRSTLPRTVEFQVSLSQEPLACTLSASEVQQLLMNLCTNAWHALPGEGGTVSVRFGRADILHNERADIGQLVPGLYAEVLVSDTGSGIEPQTLAHLFDPFFTTKLRGRGTGLGLHVVHGIVTAHAGSIVVRSRPGQGSQFHVYLPAVSDADLVVAPAEPVAKRRAGSGRVACVDDDEVVLLMMRRVLERAGFEVASFSDPAELLGRFREDPGGFDLVVTDYNMPNLSGIQLARAIREARPDMPLIVATGYAPEQLIDEVDDMGNAEILNKECTFEELAERAARALGAVVGPCREAGA